jgi:hypothetical protein
MADDPTEVARVRLLRALMAKVEQDPYPSTTMMDTIEELMTPEDMEAYTEILINRIEGDRFPSTPMIARLRNLSMPG